MEIQVIIIIIMDQKLMEITITIITTINLIIMKIIMTKNIKKL